HWIGNNIPNNQNGWIEEDAEEVEEDPDEDPEEPKDDDDDVEMDDEAEVIDPYINDGSNNPPPLNSEDEETPPTSPVIPDADGTVWKRLGKMEKFMSERIDTEGRIKKKFKEQDHHFLGLGCDNIEMDRTESVEASIRAKRERVQNEANHTEGPNIAPVAKECTFTDFMKCSPITFRGNEGAVGGQFGNKNCDQENVARNEEMDISSYTTRFNELAILYPEMVPTERKKVEAYIHGLSENIKGEVTSSEPATLSKAMRMAHTLMEQKVKAKAEREADNKKRKWENFQGGSSSGGGNNNRNRNNNNYNSNRNYNNNRNNNQNQYRNPNRNHQNNQRQGNARAMTNVGNQNTNDAGKNMKCNRYGMQHYGNCLIKCNKCGKIGHKARDCWSKVVVTGANAQPIVTCYGCGEKGHIKTNCPARNNPGRNEARGQAYALRDGDQNLGPNVVTGKFSLNNRYTRVLFDSGSDKSFVNINFSRLIDIEPVKVNHSYEVELADGRVVSTNTILRGCALNLVNHLFEIDLMPIELVSCMKFKKYVDSGSCLFVAQVVEKEPTERRLEDVPVTCKFPDVFPEDLPRLPPPRQVEFEIELVPGAAPVARAPYRLAPSEMKELAKQL
nr:hypothetical protein [Tanacetum cinerariifolium]